MNEYDHSLDSMRTVAPDYGQQKMLGHVDKYELVEKLGGGAFGVVYKARDTYAGIEVALKTLHPDLKANADELERVKENFRRIERLSHPNIASVRDLRQIASVSIQDAAAARDLNLQPGDPILVMEYARGVTLEKWKRQFTDGLVPLDQAIEIGRQVAQALDFAHDMRIVHRDIKPANIMVETLPDTQGLKVRVLDFGLAADIKSSMSRVSRATDGSGAGTRPYMAPEQWKGGDVNGAADQYALAVVLYELLGGHPPFASVFETGDPVIMMAAVDQCAPDDLPDVDAAVNNALQKALAKRPKERFASCAAFVEALLGTPAEADAGQGAAKEAPLAESAIPSSVQAGTPPRVEPATPPPQPAASSPAPQVVEASSAPLPVQPARDFDVQPDHQSAESASSGSPDPLGKWRETAREILRQAQNSARQLAQEVGELVAGGGKESPKKRRDDGDAWAAVLAALPKPVTERFDLGGGFAIEMVNLPAGAFRMGSRNGKCAEPGRQPGESLHEVRLTKPFRLSAAPVTVGQWRAVMGNVPGSCAGGDDLPVTNVSWDDCRAFAEKLNKAHPIRGCRWGLPTEAQWEFACRAGAPGPYAGTGRLDEMGWYAGNAGDKAHPVRTRQPNAWGLYDMHGNVWEWCADGWIPSLGHDVRIDPRIAADDRDRVVRGGSWNNKAELCRSASRRGMARSARFDNVGFRLVLASR